jgi:hypothetical protein
MKGGARFLWTGVFWALASPALAQGVAIEHRAIGCLLAGRHPELQACFADPSAVARARVNFRAEGGKHWYYVEMAAKVGGRCFGGVLPQPSKSTKRIQYYIDAVGPQFAESRTPEYGPRVEGACDPGKYVIAGTVPTATVVVGAASAGAPAVPAGFSALGVVSAAGTTTAGAAGAGAAGAGGGGGGGAGKALLILGGLGAAGAGAYFGLKDRIGGDCDDAIGRTTIDVSPGTAPTFTWQPDCAVYRFRVVRVADSFRMWSVVFSDGPRDEGIRPPVTYGVPPPVGRPTPSSAPPLVRGVTYQVELVANILSGFEVYFAQRTFTP